MTLNEWQNIHNYCMAKPCVYESRPFGEFPICYRVSGKIFCQLTTQETWYKATLKTNPEAADFYRSSFPGVIVRGYHCPPVQQPYWNTVELSEASADLVYQMIDEAYDEVVKHLTKKEQRKIPLKSQFCYVKTDGSNPDFAALCHKLDENLDELAGKKIKREKYEKYNTLENIHDVIIIYRDKQPVGGGGYRFYDDETVEMKRIFVDKECRSFCLGKELILRLEADAKIKGYKYAILETGELLEAATAMYKKIGYKVIPNYGPYKDMPESLCMQKKL